VRSLRIVALGYSDRLLVFYERGGGSELELFAARGNIATFDATKFRLVGDMAAGGLQVGEGEVWYANSFNDSSWRLGADGIDPWPAKADGQGSSLARIDPAAYGNDAANWKAAAPSPGAAN